MAAAKCDGPRLAAGDRPQGATCIESLAAGECGMDDMCGSCLRRSMDALDRATRSDLPWSSARVIAAAIAVEPRRWFRHHGPSMGV